MHNTTTILDLISNYEETAYGELVQLNSPFVHYIEGRINVFRDEAGTWAILFEILGYNSVEKSISLVIYGFGNYALRHAPHKLSGNVTSFAAVEQHSLHTSMKNGYLKPGTQKWLIGGQYFDITDNTHAYDLTGVTLEDDHISVADAARMLTYAHPGIFRATDEQLYSVLGRQIPKILVLDEWYQEDPYRYMLINSNPIQPYKMGTWGIDFVQDVLCKKALMDYLEEYSSKSLRMVKQRDIKYTPENGETWQQLAKVIVTGDSTAYQPNQKPNSHWSYWSFSGFGEPIMRGFYS